jgi:hypothetical protein
MLRKKGKSELMDNFHSALRQRRILLRTALAVLFLLLCRPPVVMGAAVKLTPEKERYYRAVYVLQSFGGPAAEEQVEIPAKVRRSDEAESLRFHPDRSLVLRELAGDLDEVATDIPEARLFGAYARLSLGDRRRAADLLSRYVSDAPYAARHYEILCRTLQSLGDTTALYLICREWQERDPSCRPERLLVTWKTLLAMGRFAEARAIVTNDATCLGLDGPLYAARAAEAAGDHKGAEDLVEAACRQTPAEEARIRASWQRLRGMPAPVPTKVEE